VQTRAWELSRVGHRGSPRHLQVNVLPFAPGIMNQLDRIFGTALQRATHLGCPAVLRCLPGAPAVPGRAVTPSGIALLARKCSTSSAVHFMYVYGLRVVWPPLPPKLQHLDRKRLRPCQKIFSLYPSLQFRLELCGAWTTSHMQQAPGQLEMFSCARARAEQLVGCASPPCPASLANTPPLHSASTHPSHAR
jgi:hypothetical protein